MPNLVAKENWQALTVDDVQEMQPSILDQHHATVALREPGWGLITWRIGVWATAAKIEAGVAGPRLTALEEDTIQADHPQLLCTADGYVMIGNTPAGLAGAAFDQDGAVVQNPSLVLSTENAMWPDLAVRGDDLPVAIWARPGQIQGARLGPEFETVEVLPAIQGLALTLTPSIAAGATGFVAAWAEDFGDTAVVTVQRLDPLGIPVGPSLEVDSVASYDGAPRPYVATRHDGGFAVTWRRGEDTTEAAAWVRIYDGDDRAVVELSLHETGPAMKPALASDGETLVVAWEGYGADGHHIRMRLYDFEDLLPLTEVATLSVDADRRHERPYVAVVPDGDGLYGVVSWETQTSVDDGSQKAVRIRAFSWR